MQRLRLIKSPRTMAGLSGWEALAFLLLVGGHFFIGFTLFDPIWSRWKMADIIDTTMAETDTLREPREVIASRILKRMSVNNIYGVTTKDFKIQKTDKNIRLTFSKVLTVSMPFDLDVHVKVDKVVEAKRPID